MRLSFVIVMIIIRAIDSQVHHDSNGHCPKLDQMQNEMITYSSKLGDLESTANGMKDRLDTALPALNVLTSSVQNLTNTILSMQRSQIGLERKLDDVLDTVESLQEKQVSFDNKLGSLHQTQTNIGNTLGEVASTVEGVQQTEASIDTRLHSFRQELEELSTDVESIQTTHNRLESKLDDIATTVIRVDGQSYNMAKVSDIDSMKSYVTSLVNELIEEFNTSISGRLDTLAQEAAKTADFQQRQDKLERGLNNSATQYLLFEVNNRISNHSEAMDAIIGKLDQLVDGISTLAPTITTKGDGDQSNSRIIVFIYSFE